MADRRSSRIASAPTATRRACRVSAGHFATRAASSPKQPPEPPWPPAPSRCATRPSSPADAAIEVQEGVDEAVEWCRGDAGAHLAAAVAGVQDPGGHLRRAAELDHLAYVDPDRGAAEV